MAEQQLALAGGQANLARFSDLVSPKLWRLATTVVDEPGDGKAKIAAIAGDEKLREEAARLLPEFDRMLSRASNEQLGAALQPLLVVKRQPDFGPGEAGKKLSDAWLAIYFDQLRKFPLAAVKRGVKDVLASHVYPEMPQPAVLVQAVEPHAITLRVAHYRLKAALELKDVVKTISAEERARVRQMMLEDGLLDEDGTVHAERMFGRGRSVASQMRRAPSETPQQMAHRLRSAAR